MASGRRVFMGSIIIGFLVFLVVALVLILLLSAIDEEVCNNKITCILGILFLAISIASWVFVTSVLVDSSKSSSVAWTKSYEVQKETIEDSLNNDKIGGLERVELLKQANELNNALVYRQVKCVKWYNFEMDDAVLELEPISLK